MPMRMSTVRLSAVAETLRHRPRRSVRVHCRRNGLAVQRPCQRHPRPLPHRRRDRSLDGEHAAVFGAPGQRQDDARRRARRRPRRAARLRAPTRCSCSSRHASVGHRPARRARRAARGHDARPARAHGELDRVPARARVHRRSRSPCSPAPSTTCIVGELLEGGIRDGFGPAWPDPLTPRCVRLRGFRTELRDAHDARHRARRRRRRRSRGSAARRRAPSGSPPPTSSPSTPRSRSSCGPTQFDSAELGAFAAAIVRRSAGDPEASAALGTARRAAPARRRRRAGGHRGHRRAARRVRRPRRRGRRVRRPRRREQRLPRRPARAARLARRRARRRRRCTASCSPSCIAAAPALARRSCGRSPAHIGTALGGAHRQAPLARPATRRRRELDGDPLAPLLGIEAPSHAAECQAVAGLLRERHLLDGVPWSSMAVVVRSGADVPGVRTRARARRRADRGRRGAHRAARRARGGRAARGRSLVLGREPLTRRARRRAAHRAARPPRRRRPAPAAARAAARGARGGRRPLGRRAARRRARRTRRLRDRSTPRPAAARHDSPKLLAAATRRRRGRRHDRGGALVALGGQRARRASGARRPRGTGVLADEANRALDAVVALFAAAQRFVEREPDAPAAAVRRRGARERAPRRLARPAAQRRDRARHHAAGAHRPRVRRRRRRRPAGRRVAEPAPARARCCTPACCRGSSPPPRAGAPLPAPETVGRGARVRARRRAAHVRARRLAGASPARAELHRATTTSSRPMLMALRDASGVRPRGVVRCTCAASSARSAARLVATRRRRGRRPRSPCSPRRASPARIPTTGTGSPSRRRIAPLVDLDGDPEALVAGVAVADRSRRGVAARLVHRPGRVAAVGHRRLDRHDRARRRRGGRARATTATRASRRSGRPSRSAGASCASRRGGSPSASAAAPGAWPRGPPTTSPTSSTTARCCSAPRAASRSSSTGCASPARSTASRPRPTARP